MFADELKAKGWTEITELWQYVKGDWTIDFDTGHWMIVATKNNPRVFTVSAARDYESAWTADRIDHLCRMDDERYRLREVIQRIRDDPTADPKKRLAAAKALEQCYHSWLVNLAIPEGQLGRIHCPICGRTERSGSAG